MNFKDKLKKNLYDNVSIYFLVILLITIYFGLRVKDFTFFNRIVFDKESYSLHFSKYSAAYAEITNFNKSLFKEAFTIHIAFKPLDEAYKSGFQSILMINSGSDNNQFIIAQWKRWIIIMNGCDYSHARKEPRISYKLKTHKPQFLTIVSDRFGTRLYLDGNLIKRNNRLKLTLPIVNGAYLILGNNIYETASWNGHIYGVCILNYALDNDTIKLNYLNWKRTNLFSIFRSLQPFILYDFYYKSQSSIKDLGKCNCTLNIPSILPTLKKQIHMFNYNREVDSNLDDLIINFLGFIPISFFTTIFFYKYFSLQKTKLFLLSVLFCFFLSLSIEIIQMWLPSRCSDISDILFNTLGAIVGVSLFKVMQLL